MGIVQHRRGYEPELALLNPFVEEGEIFVDLSCLRLKVGDGSHSWNDLPYVDDVVVDLIVALEQYNVIDSGVAAELLNRCRCGGGGGGGGRGSSSSSSSSTAPLPEESGNLNDGGFI